MTEFRELSQWEAAVLARLLSVDFPGRERIAEQLEGVKCRTIAEDGSIELSPAKTLPAPVAQRVPVEAEATDIDDTPIYVLLHVVDGVVGELELYKADGTRIRSLPRPGDFEVSAVPFRPAP